MAPQPTMEVGQNERTYKGSTLCDDTCASHPFRSLCQLNMTNPNRNENYLDQNILSRLERLQPPVDLSSKPKPTNQSLVQINLGSNASLESDSPEDSGSAGFLESSAIDASQTARHRIVCESGDIWVSGNTLLCSCPDCQAPMSIRLWLRLGDCWRCQTSITLTEEQYLAAKELQSKLPKPSFNKTLPPPPPSPIDQPAAPLPEPIPEESSPLEDELETLSRGSLAARVVKNGFRLTPAWMVSFILHLIVILILALIVLSDGSLISESITLSTFLSSDDERGGHIVMENRLDQLQDNLLQSSDMDLGDKELRQVLKKANQDAKKILVDNNPLSPLPAIKQVKANITTRKGQLMSFAARDPRVRSEIVRKEGGTTITEAAVARGLRWLASVQNDDGGWSLKNYRNHHRKGNSSDIMATSLALLPLLGAGQTHEFGPYKEHVSAGLAWMINNQKANGDLRAGYSGQAGMYAHGQGAIVLCEALALTGDQKFYEPAQKAIRFVELAQHARGGWRYRPGQEGDTSVFGWQMMALQSARAPELNLNVDDSTLKLADYFLDYVTVEAKFDNRRKSKLPKGSAYAYQKNGEPTAAMTAEAILCRMYLGWKKDDPRLSIAVKWLIDDHFPNIRDRNLYYWYYGTQVMHHYGGAPWEKWNDRMRELLISTQETRGSSPGSWDPDDFKWGSKGGRIYTTSLAVCTLEVYYRHLPLFKQIELDD